ncbi:thiocyanate hydrolase [Nocardia mangyaensis]|uniref:thiocyanate hydrolase n=1 Tax=Nocardia mangyaensis TaxID=2213200 RepID=UPI002676D29C|nr:thiocyanate hydrolase [Nocardia mangyaensis]MDO3646592.1 thiocyanate hydrolase [Nocardia mangyaensis]
MVSPVEESDIAPLRRIIARDQVWPRMAAAYGVVNPVPPWKSSLDGLCDALDRARGARGVPDLGQRRDDEDRLTATLYAGLPYPENQLVALAHTLVSRGIIDEGELQQRLEAVRARLEA